MTSFSQRSCLLAFAAALFAGPLAAPVPGQALPSFAPGTPAYSVEATAAQGGVGTWLGGDAANLLPLNSNPSQTVWTFGDCFIGVQGQTTRTTGGVFTFPIGSVLCTIANTNGTFTPTYFFRGTASNPTPFFPDPASPYINGGSRFTPFQSFLINGKLFIIMIRVLNNPNGRYAATVIARVSNPLAYPSQWIIDYLDLSNPNNGPPSATIEPQPALGGSSLHQDATGGGYLVIYGKFGEGPGTKTIAVKIADSVLVNAPAGNVYSSVQALNSSLQWVNNYSSNIADYFDVNIPTGAPFTVRYNPGSGRWQAVFVATQNQVNSDGSQKWLPFMAAMDSTANGSPFGPWGPYKPIYYFPEMTPGNMLYDPSFFCYPGPSSELPAFSTNPNTNIVFNYLCNAPGTSTTVFTNMNIYYPKIVQVPNPLP